MKSVEHVDRVGALIVVRDSDSVCAALWSIDLLLKEIISLGSFDEPADD